MATAIGIGVVAGFILWMAIVIITALRDKHVTLDNAFALRMLPAGREFTLEESPVTEGGMTVWVVTRSRALTVVDGRIAYARYVLIRAGAFDALPLDEFMQALQQVAPDVFARMAAREKFLSLADFIDHIALFDRTLKDELRARVVDAAEYELDRSGWDDEDDSDADTPR